MSKTIINVYLLILILILSTFYICLHFSSKKGLENYQYDTLGSPNLFDTGTFGYNSNVRNQIDPGLINPGFGNQMSELESAPDIDYSQIGQNETDASFGQLVSRSEQRDTATEIKNLPV
jgi:hypothetical protein